MREAALGETDPDARILEMLAARGHHNSERKAARTTGHPVAVGQISPSGLRLDLARIRSVPMPP
jgi:hypothetical protein